MESIMTQDYTCLNDRIDRLVEVAHALRLIAERAYFEGKLERMGCDRKLHGKLCCGAICTHYLICDALDTFKKEMEKA